MSIRSWWPVVAMAAAIGLSPGASTSFAQVPYQRSAPAPASETLFPPSDPAKEIAAALSLAKKDGKRVLLDFGADWCIDCRVLEPLFKEPEVAKFLAANFHLVRIDLGYYKGRDGMQKNDDIAKQYGVGTMAVGIPALVLLDQQGRIVPPPNRVVWRMSRLFTAPQVLGFLKELAAAR